MFLQFFRFELRYWLRSMMVYVFMVIIGLMIFGAVSSDNVQVGQGLENTYRNAPFVIQNFYAAMSLLSCLMTTAFVNGAATRDFACNTQQILFTKPLSKWGYLQGRFWGATLVSMVPMLGVSLGVIIGKWMPWNDPERWGPIAWNAHLASLLVFVIPNAILVSAIVFAIAAWTRNTTASFVGMLVLLVGYVVASTMLGKLDNERLAMLLDPFGMATFELLTKYWTVAEKNTVALWPTGMMAWNRAIWLAVAIGILTVACRVFSFSERSQRGKRPGAKEAESLPANLAIPPRTTPRFGRGTALLQLISQYRVDLKETLRSPIFLVVMLAAIANTIANLALNETGAFDNKAFPVTYLMIDAIRGAFYIFLVALITFYSGVMVWKERDANLDEVHDALPQPTWTTYVAKLAVMTTVLFLILGIGVVIAVASQAARGYTRFQLPLYFWEVAVMDGLRFFCLVVLAMTCHIASPHKYVGYFSFVAILIANAFVWNLLKVETLMVKYGRIPGHIYSDLFHFGPYRSALFWFGLYWLLAALLLVVLGMLLWQRGKEVRWSRRIAEIPARWKGGLRAVTWVLALAWLGVAGWVGYNTMILNTLRGEEQTNRLQAEYEKRLKQYEPLAQPRTTQVRYEIDLDPEKRKLVLRGLQTLVNRSGAPIERLHLSLADGYETELSVDRAQTLEDFPKLNYRILRIDPPLEAGGEVTMRYTVAAEPKGFANSVRFPEIAQNGTFFNNFIAPQVGYQTNSELRNRHVRKRLGLPPPVPMFPLDPADLRHRGEHYVGSHSDWVDVSTVISTSPDQIAIAPGSLVREWEEDGKRKFEYHLDHASLNFYSFISARYAVRREEWKGVQIEVYYHPEHEWNVPTMLRAIRDSLEYYDAHFGPYKHRQARIIEFPRIASFAQAFPGTMPYSEGIGFIADLRDPEDIDMVFYVVAHEMAHQWWAHQVVGANMEGATVLSETLAQYSALMVMEHRFGRDQMRKFLRFEMDRYLRSRGREQLKERPLLHVESSQGYIHYQKGSVVMYALKEMIGEERVNAALRSLVEKFAYQGPPFPTSLDLLEALRAQTPAEEASRLKDLFEDITLFANRTTSATYAPRGDGKYDVTLKLACQKFKADETGLESEVPLDDAIEIGAFAKPEKGKKLGATLHRERVRITEASPTFTFVVDQIPDMAGVDPFCLLIDRLPEDNTKRCVESAAENSAATKSVSKAAAQ